MLTFTMGLWLGAALGACCMGALWDHERKHADVVGRLHD